MKTCKDVGVGTWKVKDENFTVTFPINTDLFIELMNTIRRETGTSSESCILTIMADVHTVGETRYGTIDEVFSQSLTGTLSLLTLAWDSELELKQSGSITETMTVPIKNTWAVWGSRAGLIFVLLFGLYVAWNYTKVKPMPLVSAVEAEAQRVSKKHKDIIIDVEMLPEAKAGERVISLSSLDDLVKTADAFLKPVLHQVEPDKHTYCVIDGFTRYEYVLSTGGGEWESIAKRVGSE